MIPPLSFRKGATRTGSHSCWLLGPGIPSISHGQRGADLSSRHCVPTELAPKEELPNRLVYGPFDGSERRCPPDNEIVYATDTNKVGLMTVKHDGLTVDWLGYACVRIEGEGDVVYTDPGGYGTLSGDWEVWHPDYSHPPSSPYDARDGDIVVVTHDDHYFDDGVRRVAAPDATVLVYEAVSAQGVKEEGGRDVVEPEALPYDIRRVSYGDKVRLGDAEIEVVPAYNQPDGPRVDEDGTPSHPRGFGCGYVISVDDTRCFWTGDSDAIDEHLDLDVSLFLPSIAQNFTMNRHEAADLAAALDPDLVLPIHYNTFDDLRSDSGAFVTDVASRSVPVVLDENSTRARG